jgi:hypothetical protein
MSSRARSPGYSVKSWPACSRGYSVKSWTACSPAMGSMTRGSSARHRASRCSQARAGSPQARRSRTGCAVPSEKAAQSGKKPGRIVVSRGPHAVQWPRSGSDRSGFVLARLRCSRPSPCRLLARCADSVLPSCRSVRTAREHVTARKFESLGGGCRQDRHKMGAGLGNPGRRGARAARFRRSRSSRVGARCRSGRSGARRA